MSETSQAPGWWQADDGKWYPPAGEPGAADYTAPQHLGPVKTSGLAITSLVLGVISLLSCWPAGVAGLITGIMARRSIRDSGGTEQGDGLALGGIITSIIGILLWGVVILSILAVTFLGKSATSKFSSVGSAVSG